MTEAVEEEVVSPPTKPKAKKARKPVIPPDTWAKIERGWANGTYASIQALEDEFDVPAAIIYNHLTTKKIKKGQDIAAYNKVVIAELEKKAKADAKLVADRIKDTREWHYVASQGIAKMAWMELAEARQKKLPYGTAQNNLGALEKAMKVLKMAREERFAVLGLNDSAEDQEDEVPELKITELSADQIEEMRNRNALPEETDEAIISLDDGIEAPRGIDHNEDEDE